MLNRFDKKMIAKEILEKIIEEEGSCKWASVKICKQCILGQLKKRADGTYVSCYDALNASSCKDESTANKIFKQYAINMLIQLTIDEILKDPYGVK